MGVRGAVEGAWYGGSAYPRNFQTLHILFVLGLKI